MDFTTNQIAILTVSITASIALIVGIITALVTLRTNALSRKNDHKLAVLKVLLEAAYKEYEFRTKSDMGTAISLKKIPKIKSFTEYIIFYKEIAELFSKDIVTPEEFINSLKKNKILINTYYTHRELEKPEYHNED